MGYTTFTVICYSSTRLDSNTVSFDGFRVVYGYGGRFPVFLYTNSSTIGLDPAGSIARGDTTHTRGRLGRAKEASAQEAPRGLCPVTVPSTFYSILALDTAL